MAPVTRTETIPMPDGGQMGTIVAIPDAGHGPGLVVLMEIFGVGTYVQRAAERFHQPAAAARAWDLTSEFLDRELPVSDASVTR